MRVLEINPPSRDNENLAEWETYLDQWEASKVDILNEYARTSYSKARVIGRINYRIKKQCHVKLTRDKLLGLVDLLTEAKQETVHRHTSPDDPIPVERRSLTRPTELEAVARVVFEVVNVSREIIVEAPYGMLYCIECGEFHPLHRFYINRDRPRGYDDRCRECINKGYEWLRTA